MPTWVVVVAIIVLLIALVIAYVVADIAEDKMIFLWVIGGFLGLYLIAAVVIYFVNRSTQPKEESGIFGNTETAEPATLDDER